MVGENELDALVRWMRRSGVVSLRMSDGTGLDLGSEPRPAATEPAPVKVSPEQLAEQRRERKKDTLFRASGVRPK